MFSDYATGVTTFPSITHKKRDTTSSETQSSTLGNQDGSSQTQILRSIETQTEDDTRRTDENLPSFDETNLTKFLKNVMPLVQEELNVTLDFSEAEDSNEDGEIAATVASVYKSEGNQGMKVSCMSWNCTGGTLAVGLTARRHQSWCSHEGQLILHTTNLNRQTTPRVIRNSSCVSSLAFHPWEPSILAVGLYHGNVMVWDLRKQEDFAAKENTVEHSSQVINVGWFETAADTLCYSAGADGKILLRKISFPTGSISVTQRFMITEGHAKMRSGNKDLELRTVAYVGGGKGIAAAGAGSVLHIDLTSLTPLLSRPHYTDPVTFKYQSHRSIVTAIRVQPQTNTFASVSCDGEIRIFLILQEEPKYVLQIKTPTFDTYWTSNRSIIAITAPPNKVIFIRTTTGNVIGTTLESSGKAALTVMEANNARGTVAIGDLDGNVEIWRITTSKLTGLSFPEISVVPTTSTSFSAFRTK